MSLKIMAGSNSIEINSVEFDPESNSFLCCEDKNGPVVFSLNLPFSLEELPDSRYSEKVYFFKNPFINSARLLKIKLKEKPGDNKLVGYAFPISTLLENHEVFENVHLKQVAFSVILKLLQEKDLSLEANSPTYRTDNTYLLSDFYDEDLVILVICDQYVSFPGYSFNQYLSSLYKLGFRKMPTINFKPARSDCNVIESNYKQIQTTITLQKPCNELYQNYFISSLMENQLFLQDNEVARFHLYYQVIEMLLEKVYKNEVNHKVIQSFHGLSAFDAKDLLRETMKDTYSLDKLMGTNYATLDNDALSFLSTSIGEFLNYIGVEYTVADISRKIYKMRNILFHAYSKILGDPLLKKEKIGTLMKIINDTFEYIIVDLIVSYEDHNPTSSATGAVA